MSLKEKIIEDMKVALRNKEGERLSTLRLLLSAIRYAEIEKKRELKDDDIFEIINREVKKRREAIEEYRKGNRLDLSEKEERESKILEEYLPAQLSDEEIREIAKKIIDSIGAMGPKDMGKVMGQIMPQVKGRADGRRVSQIVQQLLSSGG